MKETLTKDVAKWLGVADTTLSNYFCNNRKVSRDYAVKISEITGISFEDIMLSDGQKLKKKIFLSYSLRNQ